LLEENRVSGEIDEVVSAEGEGSRRVKWKKRRRRRKRSLSDE